LAQLRIIAGERKGHHIKVPRGGDVRPTSERVREALFAALDDIQGLSVLDLFAGTGALGLEALSRGAGRCTFVEADPAVVAILSANIRLLRYEGAASVLPFDYRRAIRLLAGGQSSFDLLFVDPPYRMLADVQAALTPVLPRLLAPGSLVVIEGPRRIGVDLGLEVVFERRYADTVVTMLRQESPTT